MADGKIDHERHRYPYCVVWTPLPLITWFLPFIGHMGICTSSGIIRDFAGPYHVSEDDMAFGHPTRYWPLDPNQVQGGAQAWDEGVAHASDLYGTRMHNLCCDNCHSHVATALDMMSYKGQTGWNMVGLALKMFLFGRYVGFGGFLKTWLPFLAICAVFIVIAVFV
ncbi:hypothetical protein TCAL_07068 [Tigriopus californicus]|uniref:Transmembrane protein 222 n=1 Tax=Tigriopus californicus TaxID=6832 RepID=A0A553PQH1_TIGCA|nr:transmembrane protein 222-like [Tigriopus californicus]TRY79932.1 hypothetical protein TCAL_07068 [Tigriopus californicus]|eukprot:TCALIF_07068-PA protein Name:"Similar to TMEM222 Transmembrane protein 222 (Homo sapiens)" AED:0.07 eAED:0.07 QI:60/1/1/1/0/0/4/128/165